VSWLGAKRKPKKKKKRKKKGISSGKSEWVNVIGNKLDSVKRMFCHLCELRPWFVLYEFLPVLVASL
jgi:hypothetical protein